MGHSHCGTPAHTWTLRLPLQPHCPGLPDRGVPGREASPQLEHSWPFPHLSSRRLGSGLDLGGGGPPFIPQSFTECLSS